MRAGLLRYARSRLRNITLAEDAVSEALLAAWQARPSFPTQGQATAWVYGILRHKLVDQLRHQSRELPAGDDLPEADTHGCHGFANGSWWGMTSLRAEPEQACSQSQFVALVLRCCEQLPPLQREAFMLRELYDAEPADICLQLGVTESHLWVLVHRARLRLRTMLSNSWQLAPGDGKTHRVPRSKRGAVRSGSRSRPTAVALDGPAGDHPSEPRELGAGAPHPGPERPGIPL